MEIKALNFGKDSNKKPSSGYTPKDGKKTK